MSRKPESISKNTWKGTIVLVPGGYVVPLTDASPTYAATVSVDRIKHLIVDVNLNKGATVVVTPLILTDDDTAEAADSTTEVIADGGENVRLRYSNISAQQAVVTVTKTEAGTSTTTKIYLSGTS